MAKIRDLYTTLFLIALSVVGIISTVRDLNFYYDRTVVRVTRPEDVQKLRDNMVEDLAGSRCGKGLPDRIHRFERPDAIDSVRRGGLPADVGGARGDECAGDGAAEATF